MALLEAINKPVLFALLLTAVFLFLKWPWPLMRHHVGISTSRCDGLRAEVLRGALPYRAELDAPAGSAPHASTRMFASASIAIWPFVIVAGRMIAYV